MSKKVQGALGKNAKTKNPHLDFSKSTYESIGQVVMDSMNGYLDTYLQLDDGSSLTSSIFSNNLKDSANFSARSARIAYLLGKASLLGETERKGLVRTQIIEYGAVSEAILLDLLQSIGFHNTPPGLRPMQDLKKKQISWPTGGLFETQKNARSVMKCRFDFKWLIDEAVRVGAVDANLSKRVTWLRKSRNLVHPVLPTAQRYKDDVASGRAARDTVVALRDACVAFKHTHHLP